MLAPDERELEAALGELQSALQEHNDYLGECRCRLSFEPSSRYSKAVKQTPRNADRLVFSGPPGLLNLVPVVRDPGSHAYNTSTRFLFHLWPFRHTRQMIPFLAKGVVRQFRCSECHWTFDLESPFLYSDRARRAEESHKVMEWYSEHDCSRFAKPATKPHDYAA